MAEKKLYDKIIEKGRAEADAIYRVGEDKAKQLTDEALAEAQKEADQIIAVARRRTEDKLQTKMIEFGQQAKHNLLKKKKEMIDQTFKEAIKRLKAMPDDRFTELTVKLLKREMLTGDEVLHVAADEFNRYRNIFSSGQKNKGLYNLDKLNSLLGSDYRLKLSDKPVDVDGGFLVIGKQYDIDLSYRSILSAVREKYEPEIAAIIFGTEH